jgi:hypothetical protein
MAVVDLRGSLMAGKNHAADFVAGLMLLLTAHLASAALAQEGADSVTGFRRDPIHVASANTESTGASCASAACSRSRTFRSRSC